MLKEPEDASSNQNKNKDRNREFDIRHVFPLRQGSQTGRAAYFVLPGDVVPTSESVNVISLLEICTLNYVNGRRFSENGSPGPPWGPVGHVGFGAVPKP